MGLDRCDVIATQAPFDMQTGHEFVQEPARPLDPVPPLQLERSLHDIVV